MTVHSEKKSIQSSASSNTVMAHEKPLQVLLMDDGMDYTHIQRELLAVAEVLRAANFVVHIHCLEGSRLMELAVAQDFVTMALPEKKEGYFRNLMATWRLLWKYDKKSPCCVHAFSKTCLPLLKSFVSRRLDGTSISLYSHFDAIEPAVVQPTKAVSLNSSSKKDLAKLPRIPKMPKYPAEDLHRQRLKLQMQRLNKKRHRILFLMF